jgi:hypothetical protein
MGLPIGFLAHGESPAMNRLLRILARGAAGVVILALLAAAAIYIASEGLLRRTYDVALVPVVVPADAESIAEGRRLATIRGCNDGCHGKGVSGGMLFDGPWYYGDMVAPDLSRVAATHTDAELARVIRHGVRRNGRSTFGMPSSMFFHLTDADLGVIIAFLRSLPPGSGPEPAVRFGPLAQAGPEAGVSPRAVKKAPAKHFEVQAGPSGHERGSSLQVEAANDLVRVAAEESGAVFLIGVQNIDQMVRNQTPLVHGGFGGSDVETPVNLHRVRADDLATEFQRQGQREGRLPCCRGPDDGHQSWFFHFLNHRERRDHRVKKDKNPTLERRGRVAMRHSPGSGHTRGNKTVQKCILFDFGSSALCVLCGSVFLNRRRHGKHQG